MIWLVLVGQLLLSDVSVVDSDTLVSNGISYRLARTDGPDLAPRARCDAENEAGVAARNRLHALVGGAKEIAVRPDLGNGAQVVVDGDGWPRDAQNRRLAFVSLDGFDLGLSLVREGVAVSRRPWDHDWCRAETVQKPALSGLY